MHQAQGRMHGTPYNANTESIVAAFHYTTFHSIPFHYIPLHYAPGTRQSAGTPCTLYMPIHKAGFYWNAAALNHTSWFHPFLWCIPISRILSRLYSYFLFPIGTAHSVQCWWLGYVNKLVRLSGTTFLIGVFLWSFPGLSLPFPCSSRDFKH